MRDTIKFFSKSSQIRTQGPNNLLTKKPFKGLLELNRSQIGFFKNYTSLLHKKKDQHTHQLPIHYESIKRSTQFEKINLPKS